jgi:hypothetical protein
MTIEYFIISEPSTGKLHSSETRQNMMVEDIIETLNKWYNTEFVLVERGFSSLQEVGERLKILIEERGPLC